MIRASAPYTSGWGSFVLLKMDCVRVARGGSLSMLHRTKETPRLPRGGALPHCIVADEAFPLRMDLMRPYPRGKKQNRLAYDKSIFNYRLSRARRIVENAFGILAQRFRVFDRRIHMDDHNVIKIVNATCVFQQQAMLRELQNQGYHSTDAAQRVRRIYKDYFNSEVRAVPWQGNLIRHC